MADKLWVGGDSGGAGDWSIAANWSPSGVPGASDDVFFESSSVQSVNAGLNQSAVALGDIYVGRGYSGDIGSATAALQTDPATVTVDTGATGGQLYFDFAAQTLNVTVNSCSRGTDGTFGVELSGSGCTIGTLLVDGGKVGVCTGPGETATVTTARITGGELELGTGNTLTNVDQSGGILRLSCNVADVDMVGGRLITERAAAISSSAILYGGEIILNGSGTVAALTLHGGAASFSGGTARTVTALTLNSGRVSYDPQAVTISTWNVADRKVTITATT